VADELEPVTQSFEADLSDYIGPIEDAADETEGFADVVEETKETLSGLRDAAAEAGEGMSDLGAQASDGGAGLDELSASADDADASLDGMSASEDDATVSTEALSESVGSLRDKVYEMYPGIDEATASLLAEAAAAEAAGAANEEAAASFYGLGGAGTGPAEVLGQLKDILFSLQEGESVLLGSEGMGQFFVQTDAEAEKAGASVLNLTTNTSLLDDAMTKADNKVRDFYEGINALDPSLLRSSNLAKDARAALLGMGASEVEAAAGAAALARAAEEVEDLTAGSGGGIRGFVTSLFGSGGGIGGFVSSLFGSAGGLGAVLGDVGSAAAGMLVIVPVILAIVAEVGGLVNGIGLAGLALGGFAALAIPSLEQVKNSYESVTSAQATYTEAVQLEKRDPTKDNAAALATAAAQLKIAMAGVPSYIKPAITGFDQLKTTYQGMAKAFAPDVFGVLDKGLDVTNKLLPSLLPLAHAGATALDGLLTSLGKALTPKTSLESTGIGHQLKEVTSETGFQQFIQWAAKMAPPILETIGQDLGKLASAWSHAAQGFSKQDFINTINIAFSILIGVLNGVTHAVHDMMQMWDDWQALIKAEGNWIRDAEQDLQKFSDNLSIWYRDGEKDLDGFSSALSGWYKNLEHYFDIADDAVQQFQQDVGQWITDAGNDITRIWDRTWSAVISYTESIPGRIMGTLRGIPGQMESLGQQAILGLVHGMEDIAGDVEGEISHIANMIPSGLSSILHMLSPSLVMRERGQMAIAGLVQGLMDGETGVSAAMAHIAAAISGPGTGHTILPGGYIPGAASAGAGAGGQQQLVTNVTVQLNNQTLLKATQTASRTWNRRNVSNSLTLRAR
jgi:hypothetical protein